MFTDDILRSFMIFFKYALIFLRYSSFDNTLFLSQLHSYSI